MSEARLQAWMREQVESLIERLIKSGWSRSEAVQDAQLATGFRFLLGGGVSYFGYPDARKENRA